MYLKQRTHCQETRRSKLAVNKQLKYRRKVTYVVSEVHEDVGRSVVSSHSVCIEVPYQESHDYDERVIEEVDSPAWYWEQLKTASSSGLPPFTR